MNFSQEIINQWYLRKSNKELWIEEQERQDEILENTTSMEEKLEELNK